MLGANSGARVAQLRQTLQAQGHARAFGALTSKPYAFNARPWELRKTDTVDVMDGMGANVQVHTKGGEVVRVQPRENDNINEEWIHDKTRFSYDGLKRQRLTQPLVRGPGGTWDTSASNWRSAFKQIAAAVEASKAKRGGVPRVRAVVGPNVDLYATLAFTDLIAQLADVTVESLGSRGSMVGADLPSLYRFNTTVDGLEESDFCLLVGTNLPVEAPLLQIRLRKLFLRDQLEVVNLGMPVDLTFPIAQAGLSAQTLVDIAKGNHPVCEKLAAAEKPTILVGAQVFEREDGMALAGALETIAESKTNKLRQFDEAGACTWNGVNVVHNRANDCGHLDLGRTAPFRGAEEEPADIVFTLGVNEMDLPVPAEQLVGKDSFFVFQGHHGDELASRADVVLAGAAYTEQSGYFVNFEGRAQKARNANTPPVDARQDWQILRALSEVIGSPLAYSTEAELHSRLVSLVPTIGNSQKVLPATTPTQLAGSGFQKLAAKLSAGAVNPTPLSPALYDFYLDGNIINRSSPVMAKCSRELSNNSNFVEMEF